LAGNYSDDVEQKNEQIIGVSHRCRERPVMDNFKVNQSRSASPLVVNDIRHARVAVRPRAVKLIVPELMSTPNFVGSCFQHLPRECAPIHMIPEAFSR